MEQEKTLEHSFIKEYIMGQPYIFPAVTNRSPFRILSLIFTILACITLVFGSLILSYLWLGDGNLNLLGIITVTGSTYYTLESNILATIFLSLPTLVLVGLFSTIALLLAKRWVVAALALPIAMAVFISLYLFLVFVLPSAPAVILIVPLLLLNGGALWLARRFLIRTFNETVDH